MTTHIEKVIDMVEKMAANDLISSDTDIVAGQIAAHLKRYWGSQMFSAFVAGAEARRN